ncbi:hypothetical protein ES703_65299 [subsurface metagenome]
MKEQKTGFDKIIARIKNNRVLAVVIVLGTIMIAVSAFTDAAQNLWSVVTKEKEPAPVNISSEWVTGVLTNGFDENDTYRLFFTFKVEGVLLSGTTHVGDITATWQSVEPLLASGLQGMVYLEMLSVNARFSCCMKRHRMIG